ncbi:DMT family transporter [Yoonia sediminilitoris]|uniref:Drug/metabolite transporter (DMT)-like permease n=1 Tax=Yoonia sediminilitoris TaxID=1286148 RepID=A0A2T6KDL9_9RHOB|nr:DMT family transporter [Yoonia sediminilitoris]PUB13108.1 drug/metabolite transporter (DMT)-like permease [Yoonia sediminilitoris]RCW94443.1 drug/metabolite transporter (DMT)-like permease [Yoonia sediminilitoris]
MERKSQLDLFGAAGLTGMALLLALNQVVIKVTNDGFQPVFFAGLRSLGAVVCIWLWLKYRGIPLRFAPGTRLAGLITGCIFAAEFLCLFVALDLTTVGRSGVIFYTMPVWMALMSHFILPDDRISPQKALGLAIAVVGVGWAILDRGDAAGNLWGDLAALGAAIGWAATAMMAKASPLSRVRPEIQLFWQVAVSAPLLLIAALFFGPLVRELAPIHYAGLAFQIVIVVTAGFIFWLWLLSIYPGSSVASFAFLSPVLTVGLGWLLLGEEVGPKLLGALGCVAVGIILINRPVRSRKRS